MYTRIHRIQLALTQRELSAATGIPRGRIAKWEVEKANPKTIDSAILSKFFSENGIDIEAEIQEEEMLVTIKFAQLLIQARKSRRLSQKALAKKLAIPLTAYQKIEAGDFTKYLPQAIQRIDALLGTRLYEMIHNKNNHSLQTPTHLSWNDFMSVPYLPAYIQTRYISEYALNGQRKADSRLSTTLVPKELKKVTYWVVEVDNDRMNDGTINAICHGDKLFVREIEKPDWDTMHISNTHDVFILITTEGFICAHITQYDTTKAGFNCQYRNNVHTHTFIRKKDVYRLFYVEKIIERKIGI